MTRFHSYPKQMGKRPVLGKHRMSFPTSRARFHRLSTFLVPPLLAVAALGLAACAPAYVTQPAPTVYRCGDDVFWLSFGQAQASVTMPDGSLVTLKRGDSEDASNTRRTYTNGRLTFIQEAAEDGDTRVLFARGKTKPAPCERRSEELEVTLSLPSGAASSLLRRGQ